MNITAKYLKVWKKESNEYGITLNLGESKKKYNADGYDSWTWFKCKVKGDATQVEVNEGDTIEIKSGIITQFKTDDGRYFNDIVIFQMEVMTKGQSHNVGNYQSNNNSKNQYTQPRGQNNSYSSSNGQTNNGPSSFESDIPF